MRNPELDPHRVLAALGITGVGAVEPVRGGSDTAIWRVELAGASYALRVFRPEQASACRREVAAMAVARAVGVPVPGLRAEGSWNDRPALLISWCDGQTLFGELQTRPWRAARLGEALGRTHASIHATPAPRGLLADPDRWIEWAGPDETALKDRLAALRPRTDALLHLDYHPLNVLTRGTGITGVIDWTNALAGDPRADIARTVTILRLAPAMLDPTPSRLELLVIRALEIGWWRGYRQSSAGALDDMPLFYAWAGAAMIRDLAPKIGRPGIPLKPHHLRRVESWTRYWKRRAAIGE